MIVNAVFKSAEANHTRVQQKNTTVENLPASSSPVAVFDGCVATEKDACRLKKVYAKQQQTEPV
jgi:hypothetical protein